MLPEPSKMVVHDQLPHNDVSNYLDMSTLIAELEQDLANGPPELLSDIRTELDDLVQESSVMIDRHERQMDERKAEQIVNRFINRVLRKNKEVVNSILTQNNGKTGTISCTKHRKESTQSY